MKNKGSALRALWEEIRSCRFCQERGFIKVAKPVFSPVYPASWMLIGQAPGIIEQEKGLPFMGRAGRNLFRWLEETGWEEARFRSSVYMTSITRCWPGKGSSASGDRAPSAREVALCLPFLEREVELVSPEVVILAGKLALEVFLKINKLEGAVGAYFEKGGRTWVPLPHPSGASRWLNGEENKKALRRALGIIKELKGVRN